MDEIEDNLPHGMYDKNMEILDYGVRVLTADIEKQGREYVYYETLHVQEIQKELESQEHTAIVVSLTLLVSILIISLLLSRRITKSVTVPIQKLCNETERVAKGDFTSGPKIEAGDELAILTGSFDHMKEEIGRLIEDIRQEQNQRRVMELQLLQEQINPHFLYNTLDTIVWLAEGDRTGLWWTWLPPCPNFSAQPSAAERILLPCGRKSAISKAISRSKRSDTRISWIMRSPLKNPWRNEES